MADERAVANLTLAKSFHLALNNVIIWWHDYSIIIYNV